MLEDLGIAKPGEASLAQRLFALQNFLIERQRAGQNTVLILDEAQDLDPQTLEQIRLLSNFETTSEKILQILLVGQPELRARLDLPELRQLKQRIGLRCRIPPLEPEQVARLHPDPAPGRRGARPRALLAGGDRPDRRVQRRDPAPRQHGVRSLPRCSPTPTRSGASAATSSSEAIQYLDDGEEPRAEDGKPAPRVAHDPIRWTVLAASAAARRPRRPHRAHRSIALAGRSVPWPRHSPISRAPRAPCCRYEQVLQGARAGQAGPGPPAGERSPAGQSALRGGASGSAEAVRTLRARSDRRRLAGVPDGVDEHLVSLVTPAAFEAEQYRALRHIVEQLHRTANLQVVAVSSPGAGDGKTITAINLAGALAQAPEARVLLVDADLRRPALGHLLSLAATAAAKASSARSWTRSSRSTRIAQPRPPFNLSVICAGQTPPSPYEVLKSPRLGELFEEARRQYDYIVVDTPPLTPIQDCRVIGRWVDGFLLVVAAHRTPRRLVEEALTTLDHSEGPRHRLQPG